MKLLKTIFSKPAKPWLFCMLLLLTPLSADAALPSVLINNSESGVERTPSGELSHSRLPEQLDSKVEQQVGVETKSSKNTLAELQLFIEDFSLRAYWRFEILIINADRMFYDIAGTNKRLASLSGFSSFTRMFTYLGLVFSIAGLLEWLFRSIILRRYLRRPSACPLDWSNRLRLAFARILPEFLSLLFFILIIYLVYILIYTNYFSVICPTFLSILVTIIVIRFSTLILGLLLAPADESLRLIR